MQRNIVSLQYAKIMKYQFIARGCVSDDNVLPQNVDATCS